jgi:beta-N-acetylhexosaminidase
MAGICRSEGSYLTNLDQAAGQLIIAGFSGDSASSPGFRRVLDDLQEGLVGGVLFLTENIASRADLFSMVRELEKCKCTARPFIAIDEEGGAVDRLGGGRGFRSIQSAEEIGRGTEENARLQYDMLAKELSEIGFNMNLGPVVDLNVNPRNPVIGAVGRSFSRDPLVVEKFARIFIAAHHSVGIRTVLKHFPGHGSSATDSHTGLTDVESTWSEQELVPYRRLIGADMVDAIMVGHLTNRKRWGGVATQDGSTAVRKILRSELNYRGTTISDDLSMDAISLSKVDLPSAVVSSLISGIDVVIVAHPYSNERHVNRELNQSIVDAIVTERLRIDTINNSWQRVRLLKEEFKH